MGVAFNVASEAGHAYLATRHLAAILRGRVEERIEAAGEHVIVALDFAGVEVMTGGFADELVAKLVAQQSDHHIIGLAGMNDDVAATIRMAIDRRTTNRPPP